MVAGGLLSARKHQGRRATLGALDTNNTSSSDPSDAARHVPLRMLAPQACGLRQRLPATTEALSVMVEQLRSWECARGTERCRGRFRSPVARPARSIRAQRTRSSGAIYRYNHEPVARVAVLPRAREAVEPPDQHRSHLRTHIVHPARSVCETRTDF